MIAVTQTCPACNARPGDRDGYCAPCCEDINRGMALCGLQDALSTLPLEDVLSVIRDWCRDQIGPRWLPRETLLSVISDDLSMVLADTDWQAVR